MDAVNQGSFVALYLSPDSPEMFFFFLCFVINVGVAPEMMAYDYNHIIKKRKRINILNVIIWKKNLKEKEMFFTRC